MSYANFVPKIWAKAIERELERKLVFAEDCNRQYEGDVKQMGDTVKILGVGKPTITKQKGGSIILPDAETVEDTSVEMQINNVAYFNFLVDDIDKRQAVGGLMDALNAGRLAGAALDVMTPEPLPADHPLWTTKNLLITPHVAGNMTLGYTCNKTVSMFCDDLENYAEGRPLKHLVDLKRGY